MRNHSRISNFLLVYVYRGKRCGKRDMRSRSREIHSLPDRSKSSTRSAAQRSGCGARAVLCHAAYRGEAWPGFFELPVYLRQGRGAIDRLGSYFHRDR